MRIDILLSMVLNASVSKVKHSYTGLVLLDSVIMNAANLHSGQKVEVFNLNSGASSNFYVVRSYGRGGVIFGRDCLDINFGDVVNIISTAYLDITDVNEHIPSFVYLDNDNVILRVVKGISFDLP